MLHALERLGLKRSLYLVFALVMAVVVAVSGLAVDWAVRGALERSIRLEGENEAAALAEHAGDALRDEGTPAGAGELRHLLAHMRTALGREDALVAVLRADRTALVEVTQPGWRGRIPEAAGAVLDHPDGLVRWEGLYLLSVPVRSEADGGAVRGFVLHAQPEARLSAEVSRVRLLLLAILVAGGLTVLAGLYVVTNGMLLTPVLEMSAVASRIAEADLTAKATHRAEDELGGLAVSLNRISEGLGATVGRVRGVSEGVADVIGRASRAGEAVARGTGTLAARGQETGAAASEMLDRLRGVADSVEILAQGAEESSAALLEVVAGNEAVGETAGQLARSVEETTAALQEMTPAVKEVARNVAELSAGAEQTSAAMGRIDRTLAEVEAAALEADRLATAATREAEEGADAIARTLDGIERIKASARAAAEVVEQLGRRIGAIGGILDVLDEVAEQTNLLALNAALLAAQSGEHGKGFAVVADEIKELAERAGASTKEIAQLVRSIQDQSREAAAAMERGVLTVEEGVRLGGGATNAVVQIELASRRTAEVVKAIARGAVDQARGSREVAGAIGRIADQVQQVAGATDALAGGAERISASAEGMRRISKAVAQAREDQARGSKQITRAIASVGEMVGRLNGAQREETRGAEVVLAAVRDIAGVAVVQAGAVAELEGALRELRGQVEVLRAEVRRFRT